MLKLHELCFHKARDAKKQRSQTGQATKSTRLHWMDRTMES